MPVAGAGGAVPVHREVCRWVGLPHDLPAPRPGRPLAIYPRCGSVVPQSDIKWQAALPNPDPPASTPSTLTRERFCEQARTCLTPKRRLRSCQRKVRQRVSGWPRLLETEYAEGPFTFNLV